MSPAISNHSISHHAKVTSGPEQISVELAGDVVILSTKSGVYYGLDEVGARIWHLLKEPQTVQDLLDTILQEFDATADQCEPDLLDLLCDLRSKGLVEICDETTL